MFNNPFIRSPPTPSSPLTPDTHSIPIDSQDQHLMDQIYENLGVIGSGGFGSVFMARSRYNNHLYAIKVLSRVDRHGKNITNSALDEIKILRELNHPFIIKFHHHYFDSDRAFISLELASQDFRHLVQRSTFTEEQLKHFLLHMGSVLEYIHSKNIIHRDIKLENVLLGFDGRLKISDFGLAIITPSGFVQGNCGTPFAKAPEILRQIPYTKAVDWWALGVMAYEMLTGKLPFEPTQERSVPYHILHSEPKFPPSISHNCRTVIELLLEKDPESRICSLQQLQLADFFDDLTYRL